MKITLRRTAPVLALATIILSSPAVYAETTTTHPEAKATTTTSDSSTTDADRALNSSGGDVLTNELRTTTQANRKSSVEREIGKKPESGAAIEPNGRCEA